MPKLISLHTFYAKWERQAQGFKKWVQSIIQRILLQTKTQREFQEFSLKIFSLKQNNFNNMRNRISKKLMWNTKKCQERHRIEAINWRAEIQRHKKSFNGNSCKAHFYLIRKLFPSIFFLIFYQDFLPLLLSHYVTFLVF